jgi:prepilin-type N-terminal cleavage/methylation domain-containing protein
MKNRGFTIIELIVAIVVLVVLTSLSLANFRNGEKQKQVGFAADTVVNAVRNAQNFALTSRQISKSNCTIGSLTDKAPASYLVVFSVGTPVTLYGIDKCAGIHTIESYKLPDKTKYRQNGWAINGNPVKIIQLKYTPPFATPTYTNSLDGVNTGTFQSYSSSTIVVESDDGTVFRTVTVDGISGQIGE